MFVHAWEPFGRGAKLGLCQLKSGSKKDLITVSISENSIQIAINRMWTKNRYAYVIKHSRIR